MEIKNRLKIAIQKKGRLFEHSLDLLNRCGLDSSNHSNSLLYHCKNLPVDFLFVRDDDIPTLINNNVCDIGIVGENVTYENFDFTNLDRHNLQIVQPLGFGFCQLGIAIPKENEFTFPASLQNKKIATSYPNLLQQFLDKENIKATIIFLSGSVEIAPRLKIADMICDLVSTGQTLEENNLRLTTTILKSQAILVRNKDSLSHEKQAIFELLLCRIDGVLKAKSRKYILFHAPKNSLNEIKSLLPGTESPTILPLQGNTDKVAVHVVSAEEVFWDTLEKLKQVGASSILVLPIEKMLN